MKILVAVYSRSGHTLNLAKKITEELGAELDIIVDKKKRKGIIGWFISGKDAVMQKKTEIEFSKNPKDYDMIVLVTPVWAGRMTPAVRTYIIQNNIKEAAFFCTFGGEGGKVVDIVKDMLSIMITYLGLKARDVERDIESIKAFCKIVKNS